MKWHRIQGMLLRNMYNLRRSMDRWVDVTVFPIIDLLIFGMTVRYFSGLIAGPSAGAYVLTVITALIFWMIVLRISSDMPVVVLDDIWSRNLINIFGSPLTIGEWLTSSALVGIIKALMAATLMAIVALPLYSANIFKIGVLLIPFVFLLVLSGLWFGFIISALIVRFGTRVQAFAWTLPAMLSPFSGIYYPVSVLPHWARYVAYCLPTSYMFDALRRVVLQGQLNWSLLTISFLLNVLYIAISMVFVHKAFKRRMNVGMMKMY